MYSDTPLAVVQDCYRRWGGTARFVLEYAQIDDQQLLLEESSYLDRMELALMLY